MDRDKIRAYVQGNLKELIIYLVMGVLVLYILFVMQLQFWMKLIVVALLAFGTYEAIAKMQGKPSAIDGLQKGIQEAQKGMDLGDIGQSMQFPKMDQPQGFGPFQRRKE